MTVRLAVLIPAGPECQQALTDTLESIAAYCVGERVAVVVNDSGIPLAAPGTHIITGIGRAGVHAGLYANLSIGMLALLDYPWDVLLRIDTDGLVAAPGWEAAAMRMFDNDPWLGTLGVTTRDYDGTPCDLSWPANTLRALIERDAWLADPRRTFTLRRLAARAKRHGYEPGECVLGGICVYSRPAIEALKRHRLLNHPALARTPLSEDHLFGLALRSLGFRFANFGQHDDDLPMAAKWQGLPEPATALLGKGKALIHSVKDFEGQRELDVRATFRGARTGSVPVR